MAKAKTKADTGAEAQAEGGAAPEGGRRKKLILLAVPLLLVAIGGGVWASGLLGGLLGGGHGRPTAQAAPPSFIAIPEIVANLGGDPGHFIKLKAKLEVADPATVKAIAALMPRVLDLFQSYLRAMRPQEMRSATGTWRLREELLARANVALAPIRVSNVLFTELLVQ